MTRLSVNDDNQSHAGSNTTLRDTARPATNDASPVDIYKECQEYN